MNKAFILDLNLLSEQNLSIEEFITLISINTDIPYEGRQEVIISLQEKLFIKQIQEQNEEILIIREKGRMLIDFLSIEGINSISNKKIVKRSSRAVNNELNDFVDEFRNLWKGLKPGSMGSIGACRDKLFRWMKDNPSYTKEDILKAAKTYINSLNNYQYLQQCDYFIYKKDAFGESSRLSAFIDETDIIDEGWSSNLK